LVVDSRRLKGGANLESEKHASKLGAFAIGFPATSSTSAAVPLSPPGDPVMKNNCSRHAAAAARQTKPPQRVKVYPTCASTPRRQARRLRLWVQTKFNFVEGNLAAYGG
jgi:hypothetical protein